MIPRAPAKSLSTSGLFTACCTASRAPAHCAAQRIAYSPPRWPSVPRIRGHPCAAGTAAASDTVAGAAVDAYSRQTFYLWEEGNMPSQTEYTENDGGYADDPDFRPAPLHLQKPDFQGNTGPALPVFPLESQKDQPVLQSSGIVLLDMSHDIPLIFPFYQPVFPHNLVIQSVL